MMARKSAATVHKPGKVLNQAFFDRSVHEVARDLVGATLLFNGAGGEYATTIIHADKRGAAVKQGALPLAGVVVLVVGLLP